MAEPVVPTQGRQDRTGLAGPGWVLFVTGWVLFKGQGLAWSGKTGGGDWFFLPWWTATTFKCLGLILLFSALLYAGRSGFARWKNGALASFLIVSQTVCAIAAHRSIAGGIPWGIDHPSFMFRLKEFAAVFPGALGGYNPFWNAGIEHFVGVTSGAHGFGVLLLPLLKIWEPHVFYGGALIFWFIFAFPWIGVWALRRAGIGCSGAWMGGILLCGVSQPAFLWLWHFGTVGAMTSAMMALPVAALSYRLAILHRGAWGTALLLAVCAWLMCLWTPGLFIAAGLFLGWLWNFREWQWRANLWLIAAGILALLLLSPWLWVVGFPARGVVEYVGATMDSMAFGKMLLGGFRRLLDGLSSWHPAVLFFGIAGLFIMPPKLRRWLLPPLLLLAAITGWSREWKPLSQLDRMAIPMASLAVFPAAYFLDSFFNRTLAGAPRKREVTYWISCAAILALLAMGVRTARLHYANALAPDLRILPPGMETFVERVKAAVPEGGRLGFAGRAVHAYGGGNIAYLPVLTGREMMADDYYGFPPKTIEYNYPPAFYRATLPGYLFFSDVYGITHWATVRSEARRFLRAHPDAFEFLEDIPVGDAVISLFAIRGAGNPGRLFDGTGRVKALENRLTVELDDPSAEQVVLRYNWRNGLSTQTSGATISPFAVDENIRLIAVQPNGNRAVEIRYRPSAAPVEPNFDGRFHH